MPHSENTHTTIHTYDLKWLGVIFILKELKPLFRHVRVSYTVVRYDNKFIVASRRNELYIFIYMRHKGTRNCNLYRKERSDKLTR